MNEGGGEEERMKGEAGMKGMKRGRRNNRKEGNKEKGEEERTRGTS